MHSITPSLVKEKLLSNLEGVLSHLFPNGTFEGGNFKIGSVHGEAGNPKKNNGSLVVQLRGEDRGVWKDFAFGDDPENKGDIMKLWCKAKGKTFKEAYPEMKRYAGYTQVEPIQKKPKPLVDRKGISLITPPVRQYLNNRGLNDETLKQYKIRSHSRYSETNINFVLYPFIDSEGAPVMIKSTGIEKVFGKTDIWTPKDPYYTLWGWWMVGDDDREIIIAEGEIDAMSLHQLNPTNPETGKRIPVLSLPSGASNMDWIANDWEALQRIEKFYLVFDNDEINPKTGVKAGEHGAEICAKRLGLARCHRVPVPGDLNDVNQVLMAGDESLLDWQSAWADHAYTFDPVTIAGAEEFRLEGRARLARQKKFKAENNFIFPQIPYQFRNGECTVFSGPPGGGKSSIIYQTHAHEMLIGEKVFFCSFEIPPDGVVVPMAHCLYGREPEQEELDHVYDWLTGKMYVFRRDKSKRTELPDLLEALDYSCQRYGTTRIVVDSLHFIARKEDYEAQDNVSLQLTEFAKSHDVHVALVCHSKKVERGKHIPGQEDVEGSIGITKPIDNGITMWRNIEKGTALLKAKEDNDKEKIEKAVNMPDAIMSFWKNREDGRLPQKRMWFDIDGKSFRLKKDDEIWAPFAEPKTEEEEGEQQLETGF